MLYDKYHFYLKTGFVGLIFSSSAAALSLIFPGIASSTYQAVAYPGIFFFLVVMLVNYRREKREVRQAAENAADLKSQNSIALENAKSKWSRDFLNNLHDNRNRIEKATQLIDSIANNEQVDLQSEGSNQLFLAIYNLQEQLQSFRSSEEKRTWQAQGLAQFAELLRLHNENIKDFGFHIISETIKYVHGSQGALFLVDQEEGAEEEHLDMIGCYAYERRKATNKRIMKGEGLVGQCFQEKDIIYITDIPENYISITSGLGKALPRHILILPLINNEKMVGAMELASFSIFDQYKIDFLKDLAKNIAASISVIQVTENTQTLLSESQQLASELQAQEEEMRQNMEELEATQEEMARNQMELDGVFNAINNTLLKAEFSTAGELLSMNKKFVDFMKWNDSDRKNNDHSSICLDASKAENIWKRVLSGENIITKYPTYTKETQPVWLQASYSPVVDAQGKTTKILLLAEDITQKVANEEEQKRLSLVADNTDNSVIITNEKGLIEYVNKGFEKMTGYTLNEIKGKKPGAVLQGPETNQETVARISTLLKEQKPIYEEILNYTKSGDNYWVSLAINPVKDEDGNLKNFIAVQADITHTKKSALDAKYKLEAISRSNAVIEFDTNGMILEANQNYLDIMGYSREELIGQSHEILVSKEAQTGTAYRDLWDKLAEGEFISGEFDRVTKSGETVILKGVFNPIYDINGKAIKIVKFVTDITQEKLLQKENEKSRVELLNHMEAINKTIGSLEFDKNGLITNANEIYLNITGFKLEHIQGKSYFDLLPEKDRFKPQYQLMWESLQEGKFFSGEFKQTDVQGHEMWLSGTLNPIYNTDGHLTKVMLLAQFTTKAKQQLNELTGSVTAMKGVIPVLELNKDFTLKNANPLFFEATGYSRMSLKNVNYSESFILGKGWTELKILEELEKGKKVEAEIQFKTIEGEWVNSLVSIAGVQDLDMELSKIIFLFTGMIQNSLNLKNAN